MSKLVLEHDLGQTGPTDIQRTGTQYFYKDRLGGQGVVIFVPGKSSLAEHKVDSKAPYSMLIKLPVCKDFVGRGVGYPVKLSRCRGVRH